MKNLKCERSKTRNLFLTLIQCDIFESFVFCVLCATVFTAGMCHWVLDVEYKITSGNPALTKVDFHWIFSIVIIILVYYAIRNKGFNFDISTVILCQTFILIGVLDYHEGRYQLVAYAWFLPLTYMLGKVAVGNNKRYVNYRVEKLYFVMAVGIFITTLLDFLMNFKYASIYGYQTEIWPSFWLGGLWENRCTYELGFVLVTAATGYLLYSSKRNIFCLVFSLQANIIIQKLVISVTGRENRLLLPISISVFVILYIYDNWGIFSQKIKNMVYAFLFLIVLFVIMFSIAFVNNWAGLYDRYLDSNWSSSGGVLTNVRFSMDLTGFKNMLKYPLEDYVSLYGLAHPHSMLLEYGRVFGISIWILLVLFRLCIIKDAIVLALRKNEYSWIKYLLIPAFVAINLYYSVELNGYAHRYLWMIGLFISGMISEVAKNED